MEKIDLSTNSKQIQDLYNKVVRGDESTTYGVFSVNKNGVLSATTAGSGDLSEFVTEFADGQVQFGLARVTVPGSDVTKNLLLGWCPDNAPAKLRLSFATNFADVSKVLSGYHIQITARDQDDLDVDEFVSRVGAAAGARYLIQTATSTPITKKPAPKPVATATSSTQSAPKQSPSFVPKSTGKPIAPITPKPALPKPTLPKSTGFGAPKAESKDEDEWGGEKEIKERDFETQPLEDVPSAYKPTKVDIAELRKQKSDTISSKATPKAVEKDEESEKPEPKSLNDRLNAYQLAGNDGRLTSLPKPKVNHSVASRYSAATSSESGPTFGSKPTFGKTLDKKDKVIGGLSRNFAAENGKTPAQIWAEKRGQYKVVPQTDDPSEESKPEENELASKFKSLNVAQDDDDAPASDEPEVAEEEEDVPEPVAPKPVSSAFPAPPKRTLPPVSAPQEPEEEEEEEEEKEEEPAPAATPSLPARNLPPLPTREEPKPVEEKVTPVAKDEPKSEEVVKAIAQYDYEKDEDNEVEFKEGDEIIEIEFVDEEWWSGKNSRTGETGLFPGSYVTVIADEEPSSETVEPAAPATEESTPAKGKSAIAEYDYAKDEDNEIAFDEGDLIVEIDFVDEDWWSGKHSKTGEIGLFPANYVKLQ